MAGTEILFNLLSTIIPLREDFKAALEEELTPVFFPKDYFLLEPPRVAEHMYFLVSGFAMSFTYYNEQKQIEWFWKPNQIILSPKSFFENRPAREFIQLAAPAQLLALSYSRMYTFLEEFPEANLVYRIMMNKYYEHARERLRDMQQLSAVTRFDKLLKYYPHIEQIISQEVIASYLGITPQSLSRIKRRHL